MATSEVPHALSLLLRKGVAHRRVAAQASAAARARSSPARPARGRTPAARRDGACRVRGRRMSSCLQVGVGKQGVQSHWCGRGKGQGALPVLCWRCSARHKLCRQQPTGIPEGRVAWSIAGKSQCSAWHPSPRSTEGGIAAVVGRVADTHQACRPHRRCRWTSTVPPTARGSCEPASASSCAQTPPRPARCAEGCLSQRVRSRSGD